ncbi:MAG TPA: AMP-binding protein [Vicinamibacterales bacterium]|nr:AMP-binding protein [Vicinamibacterales bacterium]
MPRRTLLDFFADLESTAGEFLVYDDGYRSRSYSYAQVTSAAREFARMLVGAIPAASDSPAVVIWSENRPEWIVALWGCLLEGVVLVPIDYRASADFLHRVADIVQAHAVLVGDVVDAEAAHSAARPVWKLAELRGSTARRGEAAAGTFQEITADATAEIIFTSGATAEPKGVVITHRNILANIVPIEREVAKYRRWAKPFLPIRFLNLLPLSHMFGQAMATFVPPMLPGLVVFTRSYAPEDILRQIRGRRVSVLVCVPKMLEVLRDYIVRLAPETAAPPPKMHWMRRWWRYRRVHRLFGFKFWAMVVGAAPLDPQVEAFWSGLGFVVVQGYGLTETAPIVTLNHPFHAVRGAVGRPIAGVEVKIADDGEILVRGDNVTRGYFKAPEETRTAFRDGWFHTGDIGEFDAQGQLHIRGRKKEMIVTPEGLNVFPEDVERVLNEQPGIRDSAIVGSSLPGSTAERVHAVVVVEPGADLDDAVRRANRELADHQRIRAASVWPDGELPRTEGTRKLKRRELKQWLSGEQVQGSRAGDGQRTVAAVLHRFVPDRAISADTTIEELGLSSLERVELMMAIEETFQVTLDEARFSAARTVGDLEALTQPLEGPGPKRIAVAEVIDFPEWNRTWPARTLRRASLPTWILPLGRLFARVRVEGLEHLRDVKGPVLFAANHQSHLDVPVILDSLPPGWRYRVAPAMAKEFFKAHFYPEQFSRNAHLTNSLNYYLAALFFNAFPLPQREAGTRQTLRYIGGLVESGFSVLIFPEGKRTEAGEINRFQPGAAMIAARLGVPVVPIRLEGLDHVLHQRARWPTRGPVRVAFGPPLTLSGQDYLALAGEIEQAVKGL